MNLVVKKNQSNFLANNALGSEDLEFFASDSALSTPTFLTFGDASADVASQQGWISEGETASTRRTSRRISNGIMDRVAKYENMVGPDAVQRPLTPPNQNAASASHPDLTLRLTHIT
jgi:regulatory protein SWI5